ncbi:hypothetical protein EJ02DRAFT_515087 [Clathrospora elynae]|uniref:Uncharacterized protein n=1 Tax=Clathrospora elynae TaxID=706981 RepID=A0A6A5SCE4_9PLEO|nr:hypothetical protein EJ02DRAFT_515087 [Clathrospora elynae]
MRRGTAAVPQQQQQRQRPDTEQANLVALLDRKIAIIPKYHISALTLPDILQQITRALYLPNIPSEMQLISFLQNRSVLDRYAGKPLHGAQKKLPQKAMKSLSKEWEGVLDEAGKRIGTTKYEDKVVRFVGCVLPGRKDQSVPAAFVQPNTSVLADDRIDIDGSVDHGGRLADRKMDKSELLGALHVSHDVQQGEPEKTGCSLKDIEAMTVTDVKHAIAALQKVRARDISLVLLRLSPAGDGRGD